MSGLRSQEEGVRRADQMTSSAAVVGVKFLGGFCSRRDGGRREDDGPLLSLHPGARIWGLSRRRRVAKPCGTG